MWLRAIAVQHRFSVGAGDVIYLNNVVRDSFRVVGLARRD